MSDELHTSNNERTIPVHDALLTTQSVLESLGLNSQIEERGLEIKSFRYKLYNRQSELVSDGVGKGLGEQSKVSAICEAIEHYFTYPFNIDFSLLHKEIVFQAFPLPSDNPLRYEHWLKNISTSKEISFLPYCSVDSYKTMLYPVFAIYPDYTRFNRVSGDEFDYGTIYRYISGTGFATGATLEDALLHSINEIVERDAISLFLLKMYISKKEQEVYIVQPDSLPEHLKYLLSYIEDEIKQKIIIFDITSDCKMPTYLATLGSHSYLCGRYGSGTSLTSAYALERTLLELLQIMHFHNEDEDETVYEHNQKIVRRLAPYPKFLNCAKLPINYANTRLHFTYVDFSKEEKVAYFRSDTSRLLSSTLRNLESIGTEPYYRVHYNHPEKMFVVHTYIPLMERFFMTNHGFPVTPGMRGKQLL